MNRSILSLLLLLGCLPSLSGQSVRELAGHSAAISSLAFQPQGKCFASAGFDQTVLVWDASRGEKLQVCKGHQDKVTALTYFADGRLLASASLDRTIRLWDTTTGQQRAKIVSEDRCIQAMTVVEDRELLYCAGESGMLLIFDLSRGWAVRRIPISDRPLYAIAASREGRWIATAGLDGKIYVLDHTGRQLQVLDANVAVFSLAFDPSTNRLVCGGANGEIQFWDLEKRRCSVCQDPHHGAVYQVSFTQDGRRLVTAGLDGQIVLRHAVSGSTLDSHRLPGKVLCATVSPDGSHVIGGTGTASAWCIEFPRRWR